jgi:membrane dipeptidase
MKKYTIFCLLFLTFSCTQKGDDLYLQRAKELLKTTPVVDTHIDFPWYLVEHNEWYKPNYTAFALRNPGGEFDYERAKAGGLYGAFMSIYIPSRLQKDPERPRQVADSLIQMIYDIAKAYPDKFAIPIRAADVESNFKKGIISLPMGMENGAPITNLNNIAYFHERGIRYVTLTHALDNHISDSSYDTLHLNEGLSPFGKNVVHEMNRVGIMVDVSHLSDAAISDVLEVTSRPVVATHSACRHFTPGFERNLTDDQIRAIAAKGGVIQVPFSALFLDPIARKHWKDTVESGLEKLKLNVRTPEGEAYVRAYEKEHNVDVFLSVKTVVNHIDHIVKIAGIDAVGLGSDFDGTGPTMPPDLRDVSTFPVVVAELLRRGYKDEEVKKICGENLIRVWKACE